MSVMETTNLFSACVRAGYNGRNSASFVGKVVTLCLFSGLTDSEMTIVFKDLARSAPSGQIQSTDVRYLMEVCPTLAQVIAEAEHLPSIGLLRGKDVGFEVVFHAVIDYKVKH